jgi:hypothetical protein
VRERLVLVRAPRAAWLALLCAASLVWLACGGVFGGGEGGEEEGEEEGEEKPRKKGKKKAVKEAAEEEGEEEGEAEGEEEGEAEPKKEVKAVAPAEAGGLSPTTDVDKEALPAPLRSMMECLSVKSASKLAGVSAEDVQGCLKERFGGSKGPGRQCADEPEEVYSSEVLDPCTFDVASSPKGRPLSSPREGLGRLHAVFVRGDFQGFVLQSTRPTENSAASCGATSVFQAQEIFLKSTATQRGARYARAGLELAVEHEEVGTTYPVVRDHFILKIEGQDKSPALAADWERVKVRDLPSGKRLPRELDEAMVGSLLGCRRYQGSLLELLGQPIAAVKKDCAAFSGGGNAWAQWPVMEVRIAEDGNRLQLSALGTEGKITEIFLRMESGGGRFMQEMQKELGRSTQYQCTAQAWRSGEYMVRARPAGQFFNLAFTRVSDHDNFSMVVPGATVGPDWR